MTDYFKLSIYRCCLTFFFISGICMVFSLPIYACSLPINEKERYKLKSTPLLETAEDREFLTYLISCALRENSSVFTENHIKSYEFSGGMGLAPNWLNAPLGIDQQKWVSACILARTNKFGMPVKISVRTNDMQAAHLRALSATAEEKENYPVLEAGFYGNLFTPDPVAYVCTGTGPGDRISFLMNSLRVCSLPEASDHFGLTKISQCGFIITGPCSRTGKEKIGNEVWDEVIYVYLRDS